MPKRRVPGHLNRTGRRRRGPPTPNLPAQSLDPAANRAAEPVRRDAPEPAPPAPSSPPPPGRLARPTQRAATAGRYTRGTTQLSLEAEYQYVKHDLRQIGLLAALAFVALAVLTVVIR